MTARRIAGPNRLRALALFGVRVSATAAGAVFANPYIGQFSSYTFSVKPIPDVTRSGIHLVSNLAL